VSRYKYEFEVEVIIDADDEETAEKAFEHAVGQMGFRGGVLRGDRSAVDCSITAWQLVEVES